MKRTLIVATTSYAGMGPYVSEIVNNFSKDDNIYYFFHDYEDDFFLKNVKKELHDKSYFYKRANSKINKVIDLLPIKPIWHNIVLDICKKYDINVVHFINGPGDVALQKSLETKDIKCVSTIHDLHPHESKKEWYKELRARTRYKRFNKNLLYSRNIITNSLSQYNELKQNYDMKNIYYHSFPTLVSKIIQKGQELPMELACLRKPYILFFGRIEEYKGISLLYRAFTESPNLFKHYSLVIAGKGNLPFHRISNEEYVIILNRYIKDTEIANMYKNAACVVYPYISATQSGVLSLAYYFKTPLLASDVPFFKDNIQQANSGLLFKRGDISDLKIKILQLLNSDTSMQVEKGKEYYDKYYDGIAIRSKLIDIYNDIL